jgi:hypothetical protein
MNSSLVNYSGLFFGESAAALDPNAMENILVTS